jgi:hypothetical protein
MAEKYFSDEFFEALENYVDAKIVLGIALQHFSNPTPEHLEVATQKVLDAQKELKGQIIQLSWIASSK